MLRKLKLPPGVNKESTDYAASGTWFDSNNVRFRGGFAESIGGWREASALSLQGVGRGIFSWITASGTRCGCVGTNWKFYALIGDAATDITPIRDSSDNDNMFAATNGSSIITVTDASHGAVLNDFVGFEDAASLGGTVIASVLNTEHQITERVNDNSYKIDVSPIVANGSDTGNGGTSTVAYYLENVGLVSSAVGGAGGFGVGTYGGAVGWSYSAAVNVVTESMRTVSIDNYNEDLIISYRGGPLFYWDVSENIANGSAKATSDYNEITNREARALSLASFDGYQAAPVKVESFFVSDRDGHCIAFGVNALGSTTLDPLLVRWSDQNNPFHWKPESTNTAGGQSLTIGSRIVRAIQSRSEILIFTDAALYSMQFVGPPDIFSFQVIATNVNIFSGASAIDVSNVVYFMADDGFYAYTGSVTPMRSPVSKYIFDDINRDQREKVFAGSNSAFSEVYWLYPSSGSDEPDRYVCFNYSENVWYNGSFDMSSMSTSEGTETGFARTSWEDIKVRAFPSATYIKEFDATTTPPTQVTSIAIHEVENNATGVEEMSGSSKVCSVTSGDVDISDGDSFSFVSRFVPDIKFYNGSVDGEMSVTVTGKDYPGGSSTTSSTVQIVQDLSTGTYTPTGNNTAVRLRGRAVSFKFETTGETFSWRMGDSRADVRPDGRR